MATEMSKTVLIQDMCNTRGKLVTSMMTYDAYSVRYILHSRYWESSLEAQGREKMNSDGCGEQNAENFRKRWH